MSLFVYNSDLQVVICPPCRVAVRQTQIRTHLQRAHPHLLSQFRTIEREVQQWLPTPADELPDGAPSFFATAIPYLPPPYEDGLLCSAASSTCQYVCRSLRAMKEHLRTVHSTQQHSRRGRPSRTTTQSTARWRSVLCQRLFVQGRDSHYFQILQAATVPPSSSTKIVTLVDQIRTSVQQKSQQIIEPGATTELTPWLNRTGWLRFLAHCDRTMLLQLRSPPPESVGVEWRVWTAVAEMVQICHDSSFRHAGVFVRSAVVQTDQSHRIVRPLLQYQDDVHLQRSGRIWQQIVVTILRTTQTSSTVIPHFPPLTDLQTQAFDLLRTRASSYDPDDVDTGSPSSSSSSSSSSSPSSPSSSSSSSTPLSRFTPLQEACHAFCLALIQQHIRTTEYESVLVATVAILGLTETSWHGPDTFSSILSGVIKITRLLIVRQGLSQDEETCVQYVRRTTETWLQRGTTTPMEWVLDLRAYAMNLAFQITGAGKIDWSYDRILYQDLCFSMSEFRACVHGLFYEVARLLHDELLLLPDLDLSVRDLPSFDWQTVVDQATRVTVGESFLDNTRNPSVGQHRDIWLWHRLQQHTYLRTMFLPPSWSADMADVSPPVPARTTRYLNSVVRFRTKLLLLIHLTGGQPARIPELLSVRHRNTASGQGRGVVVDSGLVSIITTYNKTQGIQRLDKVIYRFLPTEVGLLLVRYLWLALPFVERLQAFYNRSTQLSALLWPDDPLTGRKWSTDRVRHALEEETLVGLGQAVNIQTYRHLAVGISRKYLRPGYGFLTDEEDLDRTIHDDNDILAQQTGHSSRTHAGVYGREMNEPDGSLFYQRQRFREISQDWHNFLGFPSAQTTSRTKRPLSIYQDYADRAQIRRDRLRTMDPQVVLRRLHGPAATFRPLQRRALDLLVRQTEPLLVVMPTGLGKSLLFLLPAAYDSTGTTVVIVPLVALRQDLFRRCQVASITCHEWSARTPPEQAQIVLVTPEAVVTDSFRFFLQRLRTTQQLDRIVLDECHLLLHEQGSYRHAITGMLRTIQSFSYLLLLTATLPPTREAEIWERLGVLQHPPFLLRTSTRRSNLEYRVRVTPDIVTALVDEIAAPLDGCTLIFVRTIAVGTSLAQQLHHPFIHAQVPSSQKEDWIRQLHTGQLQTLITTSVFGLGIDISTIRRTIHMSLPYDLLSFVQESGRAGRDGRSATCIILLSSLPPKSTNPLLEFVRAPSCYRLVLDNYLDGQQDPQPCQVSYEAICQHCQPPSTPVVSSTTPPRRTIPLLRRTTPPLRRAISPPPLLRHTTPPPPRRTTSPPPRRTTPPVDRTTPSSLVEDRYRQRVQRSVQQQALSYDTFQEKFEATSGCCFLCLTRNRERHSIETCPSSDRVSYDRLKQQLRTTIRYQNNTGCWTCGLPRQHCSAYEMTPRGFVKPSHIRCRTSLSLYEIGTAFLFSRDRLCSLLGPTYHHLSTLSSLETIRTMGQYRQIFFQEGSVLLSISIALLELYALESI